MELASISSFNLGVAITAISILLALASFSLNTKFDLRVKLRVKLMWLVVILSGSSIGLTFLAEFSNIFQPFILQITGAIFMVIAIILYTFIIFRPIKTINIHNSHRLIDNLNKFLIRRNQNELLKNLDDITYFYDSLLNNSTKNSDLRQVFNQIFTSNLFLTLFSEHPYLFEKTIHFYIQNQEKLLPVDLYHIKQFINDLFVKSLNNQNSFLNSFLNEEIYPNSRSYLDDLFVERIGVNYSDLLFRDIRFNSLSIEGKLSYMKMVKHYFQVIHRKNMSHKNTDGYEKKVDYNSNLIKNFFEDIKSFFEHEYDQNNLRQLFSALQNIGLDYRWAVRTQDKSKALKIGAGEFLYDVLHSTISKYRPEHEGIFRLNLWELFDKYIETQDNDSESNIAFKVFTGKIREKIIKSGFGSNLEGYYPAMIKVYFYLFGYHIFSEKCNEYDLENLHLPILIKMSESFPKLYNGFKQQFYALESLPSGKEEKLQKEGRKIINEFLPSYITYNFQDNSLTFFYSGNNFGSKVLLNKVRAENKITIKKV